MGDTTPPPPPPPARKSEEKAEDVRDEDRDDDRDEEDQEAAAGVAQPAAPTAEVPVAATVAAVAVAAPAQTGSTKRSPSDFLKTVLGRPVVVKLNSGIDYRGVLACLDGYMNIAMEQTEEYVNGQLKAKYGDCFIRGNNELRYLKEVFANGWCVVDPRDGVTMQYDGVRFTRRPQPS